jgi:mono/diheme cytochrome c family protein
MPILVGQHSGRVTARSAPFETSCASCHQWNGDGQQSNYAALLGAHAIYDGSGKNVIKTILHGASLHIGPPHVSMPNFASLSNTEIVQIGNYVIFQLSGKPSIATSEMVAA